MCGYKKLRDFRRKLYWIEKHPQEKKVNCLRGGGGRKNYEVKGNCFSNKKKKIVIFYANVNILISAKLNRVQ